MIQRNRFYCQTNQKKKSLASPQIVSKDGYRVELPATCFKKANGFIKANVFKAIVGHWDKEKVQYLVSHFGAVLLSDAEKGA